MIAKEMFEKLGFYYEERAYGFSYDAYDSENGWLRFVAFDIENKTVEIHRINIYWNYETKYTKHTRLDKAINKQIEELGWNKC